MSANPRSVTKAVKLDPDIKSRLDRLGKTKHRSPHWLMQEAISRYLDQEEHNEQLKQETLSRWQEAEQGRTISHQAVDQWLSTWGTDQETHRPPCGS